MLSYLASVKARDPAARSRLEILLYPGVWAVGLHRIAHALYRAGFCVSARIVNHFARFLTGIDIHPGAVIGRNFFADHGFAVIGETAVVGANVTIYSGVTLGGSNPSAGKGGKRHPTLCDDVVVGSGAQIIGAITIGAGARIGANAVVTKDVAPGSVIVGIPGRPIEKAEPGAGEAAVCAQADKALEKRLLAARTEAARLVRDLAELSRALDLATDDAAGSAAPRARQADGRG